MFATYRQRTTALWLILSIVTAGAAYAGSLSFQAASQPLTEERIRQEADRRLGGPLAHLSEETKFRLVRVALGPGGRAPILSNETFRDKLYLEIILHSGSEEHAVTAEGTVDRGAAVRKVTASRLIPTILEYGAALGDAPGVYGVKLMLIEMPANAYINFYVPLDLIKGVRSGAVTPQALLDGSVMYVNNDIVRVRLEPERN